MNQALGRRHYSARSMTVVVLMQHPASCTMQISTMDVVYAGVSDRTDTSADAGCRLVVEDATQQDQSTSEAAVSIGERKGGTMVKERFNAMGRK